MCGYFNKSVERASQRKAYNYQPCGCTYQQYQQDAGHSLEPLVELVQVPRLNVGIRALENISQGQILGLYVREIYPYKKGGRYPGRGLGARYGGTDSCSYLYSQRVERRHPGKVVKKKPKKGEKKSTTTAAPTKVAKTAVSSSKTKQKKAIKEDEADMQTGNCADLLAGDVHEIAVDSAVNGNWTRYINHSCDYNTEFAPVKIGQRKHLAIKARREIGFGEAITVNYGDEYFPEMLFNCACYVETCKKWHDSKTNAQTLLEALNAQPCTAPQ